jgi:lipoprotein NlpD
VRALAVLVVLALIAGCASPRRNVPVEDRRPPARPVVLSKPVPEAPGAPSPSVPDGHYMVKKGDTLYSIALDHGHDYREIAQWNSLDDPTKISAGQVLRLIPPSGPPPQPAVVIGSGLAGGRIESRPLGSAPMISETKPATPPSTTREEPRLLEAQPLTFAWPVKGKVVAGFAEPRQKGIDIQGKTGDAVIAAAGGRVTYVGSGIPGLGKLIVIKHDQGYITVYAHNKDILVKEQQSVTRGQKIAELGEKLHFQIRKGAAAVDPLLYLPKS